MSLKKTALSVTALSTLVLALAMVPRPAAACGERPLLGEICVFPYVRDCPRGFLETDGRLLPVIQYAALYSLLGNNFGGDGIRTFGLPDLRGRSPMGAGVAVAPLTSEVTLGQKRGGDTALSATNLPGHTHPATFAATTGQQQVTIPATTGSLAVTASLPASTATPTSPAPTLANGQPTYLASASGPSLKGLYTTTAPAAGNTATFPATVAVTGNGGTPAATVNVTTVTGGAVTVAANKGTQPLSMLSPQLGVRFCISSDGLYPNFDGDGERRDRSRPGG